MDNQEVIYCKGTNSKKNRCKRKILLTKNPNGYCIYHSDQNINVKDVSPKKTKKNGKKCNKENKQENKQEKYINYDEDIICAICQDSIGEKQVKLRCNHEYCMECISQIRRPVCPLCNQKIKKNDIGEPIFKSINQRCVKDNRKRRNEEDEASREAVQRLNNLMHNNHNRQNFVVYLIPNANLEPDINSDEYGYCIDFCMVEYCKCQEFGMDLHNEECYNLVHEQLHSKYPYSCEFLHSIQEKAVALINGLN